MRMSCLILTRMICVHASPEGEDANGPVFIKSIVPNGPCDRDGGDAPDPCAME